MLATELKSKICKSLQTDRYYAAIQSVSVFGSHINGQSHADSDLDLLISFVPGSKIGLLAFAEIRENLERDLGCRIDLLTEKALSDYFREEVISQAELVYEK